MCLVRWRKDSNKQTQIYPSIHQVGSRFPQGWFGKHHLSQKVAMSGRRFLSICVVGIGKVVVHQCSQWSKTQRWYIYIYTGTTECAATNDTLLLNASWFIKTKPSAKNNTIFKPLKHIPTINIYIYISTQQQTTNIPSSITDFFQLLPKEQIYGWFQIHQHQWNQRVHDGQINHLQGFAISSPESNP